MDNDLYDIDDLKRGFDVLDEDFDNGFDSITPDDLHVLIDETLPL